MRYLPLILATAFWGANSNIGKMVLRNVPPLTGAALRFTIATVVIVAVYAVKEGIDWQRIRLHARWYVALGILGVFGFNVLFFLGLQYTSPVNSALMMAANPLWTVVVASFILHDRLRAHQKVGLAVSLVGIFFVVTGGSWNVIRTMSVSAGDGLILMGGICWAIYSVLVRKHLHDSSTTATTALTMLCGTLAMIPLAMIEPRAVPLADLPGSVWLGIAFMAVPGAVLAYLFWNRGMTTIGPAKAAVFYNLIPVFTVLIAVATGDRITASQVIGGLVVISGCLISETDALRT